MVFFSLFSFLFCYGSFNSAHHWTQWVKINFFRQNLYCSRNFSQKATVIFDLQVTKLQAMMYEMNNFFCILQVDGESKEWARKKRTTNLFLCFVNAKLSSKGFTYSKRKRDGETERGGGTVYGTLWIARTCTNYQAICCHLNWWWWCHCLACCCFFRSCFSVCRFHQKRHPFARHDLLKNER